MKSFITSQFGYCTLVWMFRSRELNNRINKIYEDALRLFYNDNLSTLFDKDNSVTIRDRNLQALATEVYKSINRLSPVIMKGVFDVKNSPNNEEVRHILCTRNTQI